MSIPLTRSPNHAERRMNALKAAPGVDFFCFFLAMIQADSVFWVDKPGYLTILKHEKGTLPHFFLSK
ncbi:MAG: hypothetical protein E7029_05860 [Planctomycetaceae bacterium]|nr:hypothetical protein [Planctomycetaceae bacterium]MBP3693963.1 hypothetical protein [Thermoguttaceae bacterium]